MIRFVFSYSCTLTFQTLLGSFSQRTSQKLSLYHSAPFPLVLRVQRYTLFLSLQHFFKLFSFFFELFFITLIVLSLQQHLSQYLMKKLWLICLFTSFLPHFSPTTRWKNITKSKNQEKNRAISATFFFRRKDKKTASHKVNYRKKRRERMLIEDI